MGWVGLEIDFWMRLESDAAMVFSITRWPRAAAANARIASEHHQTNTSIVHLIQLRQAVQVKILGAH